MKKIISIVGARPNFMKVAPIHNELKQHPGKFIHLICHTGQHYDEKMSDIFFNELELPRPDFNLGVGSGSHAAQTASIMVAFESALNEVNPDAIIVVGDVNSTVACSLVAAKIGIPVYHVEAGLRSFDRRMPEEINRVVTDAIADLLFVSEPSGMTNLRNEGVSPEKVFFVGNVMIDSLARYLPNADRSMIFGKLGVSHGKYVLVTLHRPANVDNNGSLGRIVSTLNAVAQWSDVVFPVHPRTRERLKESRLMGEFSPSVKLTDPMGYIDFIALIKNARLVITDSGGIQEETTYLGIPCLTMRENTERPITIEQGTNRLVGTDYQMVLQHAESILNGNVRPRGAIPDLWDGKTASRIVSVLLDRLA